MTPPSVKRAPDKGPRAWRQSVTDRCPHGRVLGGAWIIRDLGRDGPPTPDDWADSDLEYVSDGCLKCNPERDE